MKDLIELSKEIGINYRYLRNLIINRNYYYYSHYIKKRSGGLRRIDSPNFEIKAIQSWILNYILEKVQINERVNGFVRGRGIKTNAAFHLEKKYILCLDIKDFFNSTSFKQVKNIFEKIENNKYKNIAYDLAKICTFNDYLPQGGVTSPALSNLVFQETDDKIIRYCNKKNICYTRYADDMSFSSDNYNELIRLESIIIEILNKNNYKLNDKKTRLYSSGRRMMVTGLILNTKKLTIGRTKKREIRGIIHNYLIKENSKIDLDLLLGKISFLKDIEPHYYKNKLIPYIQKLKKKKEYLKIKLK